MQGITIVFVLPKVGFYKRKDVEMVNSSVFKHIQNFIFFIRRSDDGFYFIICCKN